MQINSVQNATQHNQNFGATIKNTKALNDFVQSLSEGNGILNNPYRMPREKIISNFERIHVRFPKKTDSVVFTEHSILSTGVPSDDRTKNIVKGYVISNKKKADFAFTYSWRDFIDVFGFNIKNMHSAMREAAIKVKKINIADDVKSIVGEITKRK